MGTSVGSVIIEEDCHIPEGNKWKPFLIFQNETCGPESVAIAAHEFVNKTCRVASFAVADHPKEGGIIKAIVTVGVHVWNYGQRREILFTGCDRRISGGGSHILCVDDAHGNLDVADIAARLVYHLVKDNPDGWIFRLKEDEDTWKD